MKLIIVRHGETDANRSHILMGHAMVSLNDLGKNQARLVGEGLKSEKIDFIYSSDLQRTKETVQQIINQHPNVPVIYDPLLRERCLGRLEGLPREKFYEARNETNVPHHLFRPDEGESMADVLKRVEKFLKMLFEKHSDNETILICTHGGWKRMILALATDKPISDEEVRLYPFENTSVTVIEAKPSGKLKLIKLNNTEHLK